MTRSTEVDECQYTNLFIVYEGYYVQERASTDIRYEALVLYKGQHQVQKETFQVAQVVVAYVVVMDVEVVMVVAPSVGTLDVVVHSVHIFDNQQLEIIYIQ
jgi:hypothetical protein